MKEIRAYFDQFLKMTDEDWLIFSSKLIHREFDKNTVILPHGKTERYLNFLSEGSIRHYIPHEDKDLTFGFSFQGQFMSAYDSFITQTPCTYQTESLSHTVLFSLHYNDLQEIYQQTTVGNELGRIAAENQFLIKSKRELSLLNESAEERYLNLFTERPELIQKIPLKYLASYIGVTPQALSRIRKRIS